MISACIACNPKCSKLHGMQDRKLNTQHLPLILLDILLDTGRKLNTSHLKTILLEICQNYTRF